MEQSDREKLHSIETKKSTVEQLIQQCVGFHSGFDQKWREKGHISSFHNQNHINATINAAVALIRKAFSKEGSLDPLNLKGDFQRWNEIHPQSQITEYEFLEVVRLAFSMHDLGNIASGVRFDEKGELVLDYLDGYKAQRAEERSEQIAELLINNSGLEADKKQRYLTLIKYLIAQTTYEPNKEDKDKPLVIFARLVDQIGGNLFNNQTAQDNFFGLVEEGVFENGKILINPYRSFNFVNLRLSELVEDEEIRKQIFEAFGKEPPNNDERFRNEQIVIKKEELDSLRKQNPSLVIQRLKELLYKLPLDQSDKGS